MKRTLLKISIVSIITIVSNYSIKAQSTQSGLGAAGHSALGLPPTHYLGWDAASNIPCWCEFNAV